MSGAVPPAGGEPVAPENVAATLPGQANLLEHPVMARLLNAQDRTEERQEKHALQRAPNDAAQERSEPVVPPAPTGELTLAAICDRQLSWPRRLGMLAAVLAINIGLPFVNGIMLGFGEIFARAFLAPWLGIAPPLATYNRFSPSPADVPPLESIPPGGIRSWARGVLDRRSQRAESPQER